MQGVWYPVTWSLHDPTEGSHDPIEVHVSGLLASYIEEQLQILEEWDADELTDALGLTTEELLAVPEFRNRAKQWITDNGP